MMDETERLRIVEACRETVLRAAAAVDGNDPAAFARLFTPEGELTRPNGTPLQGRAAIQSAYEARPPGRITRHLVTNTLVDVEGPMRARARSLVLLWGGNRDDAAGPQGRPADARQLLGEFDDVLERTDEGWRIARREARFVLHAGS